MCLNGSRGLSEGIERGVRRRGFEGVKTVGFLILFLRLLGSKMVKMAGVSFVGVRVFGFFRKSDRDSGGYERKNGWGCACFWVCDIFSRGVASQEMGGVQKLPPLEGCRLGVYMR